MKTTIYSIFILLFFFSSLKVNSQIEEFTFDNYTPIWSYYSGADGLSTNIQAILTTPYPIITNDHVYVTSNIFDKTLQNGHISEKLNIKTGERIWSNFQYETAPNKREYAQSPYLENGNYKVNIYKEILTQSGPFSFIWSKSILMRRNYDDATGLELDSLVTDSLDIENKVLNLPESIINNATSILFSEAGDNNYMRVLPTGTGYLFTSFILDDLGHQIDSIGLEISRTLYNPIQVRTFPSNDGSNLFMIVSENSIDSQSVEMVLMDKKLNILQYKEIIDLLPKLYENHYLVSVTNGGFYIMSSRNRAANNLYDLVISKFNFEMELIESLTFNNNPQNIGLLELADGTTLAAFAKVENGFSNLYFYKSNGQGGVELENKLICTNSGAELFVKSLYLTKDNDLLANITHVDVNSSVSPIPKWNNWTLFKGSDFGITTSIKEQHQFVNFQVVPNPASSTIMIKTDAKFDEVVISSINGATQLKLRPETATVDISNLQNGLYICELRNKGLTIGVQKVVVMD